MRNIQNIELLVWILCSGAFGGFVNGLMIKRSYCIRWPKSGNQTELGSFGDILIGAAASVAVFSIAGSLLNIDLSKYFIHEDDYLKVIALSILSGYSGIRILHGLSEKYVMELAGKAAEEKSKEQIINFTAQYAATSMEIKAGSHLLNVYDKTKNNDSLEMASLKFNMAIATDSSNDEAWNGLGRVKKRKALQARDAAKIDEEKVYWQQAIDIFSKIIQRSPNTYSAYYNRACCKNLSGDSIDEVILDLAKAIKINLYCKDLAKIDDDFKNLRETNNQKFNELVEK